MEDVVESYGDRFADVVENVKLKEAIQIILPYVGDIINNDLTDIKALHCAEVLASIDVNTSECIGSLIS